VCAVATRRAREAEPAHTDPCGHGWRDSEYAVARSSLTSLGAHEHAFVALLNGDRRREKLCGPGQPLREAIADLLGAANEVVLLRTALEIGEPLETATGLQERERMQR
jgi:hypothetical protein